MALWGLNKRYRHLGRYRQVLEVLLRHGFGFLVEQVDLSHLIPLRRRVLGRSPGPGTPAVGARLRSVFEDLGPTFVKLGQLLSTRADLLSPEILRELAKLQDHVPPFSSAAAIRQIEQETGKPLSASFRSFETEPIAAASIGQVHRGVLPSGEVVVVKVQRPDVSQTVATDVEILLGLARRAQERLKPKNLDFNDLAQELARTIRRELDYTVEGRQIERFQHNFTDQKDVIIPRVHWDLTTRRILTLEYVSGIKVDQHEALDEAGIDRRNIARVAARAFMKQVIIDGYFHADPHPGNILVVGEGQIAFLDFGMVGRLGEDSMELLVATFWAVTRREMGHVAQVMAELGAVNSSRGLTLLQRDLEEVFERYYGRALKQLDFASVLQDLQHLAMIHAIRLPTDFLLLGKAFLTLEGVAKRLDPDFDITEVISPFARQLLQRRFDPQMVAKKAVRSAETYIRIFQRLPHRLDKVTQQLERGELAVQFRHVGLERLTSRLDIISNRISVAVIVAALIIGSALILAVDKGPVLFNMPILGLAGFIAAALTGAWLVWAILRSGRI